MKSISFIFNKAPYGNDSGRELLDICLMASAFDMPITAIFKGEGLFQLIQNQEPEIIDLKNHSKTFKALELYGVENILICQDSLKSLNIESKQLMNVGQLASQSEIKSTIHASNFVITL